MTSPQPPKVVIAEIEVDGDDSAVSAPPAFNAGQLARAKKQEGEDQAIQKLGWRSIVGDEGARLMEEFEAFAGGKIMRTIDATHGAMLGTVASAALRIRKIEAQMAKIESKYAGSKEEMSAEDMAKMQMLHEQWMGCAKILKDCNGEATKAAHIRVMMAAKAADAVSEKRNKKPAWKRVGPGTGGTKK